MLPFRQERQGPPRPGDALRDREGLRAEVLKIRETNPGRIWMGGHSFGGRQASMLAAESPGLVEGLLLLSYPLHPPKKPEQLRTGIFQSSDADFFCAWIARSVWIARRIKDGDRADSGEDGVDGGGRRGT